MKKIHIFDATQKGDNLDCESLKRDAKANKNFQLFPEMKGLSYFYEVNMHFSSRQINKGLVAIR